MNLQRDRAVCDIGIMTVERAQSHLSDLKVIQVDICDMTFVY